MSGWAQRDAETKEYEMNWKEKAYADMAKCLDVVDDFCEINIGEIAESNDPNEYHKVLNLVLAAAQSQAIYLEHQRLIKLNEDFYGPAFRDENVPFV